MTIFGSGHQVVTSTTRPASPLVGQIIYETDTFSHRWWNGTAWEGVTPIGSIQSFAGSTAPSGWLICDGQTLNSVANTQYAALYSAITTTYGGTSASSFQIPDLKGRAPVGKGANVAVNALNKSDLLADASRNPNHTHTIGHTHTMGNHTHSAGGLRALWIAGGGIMYWQQTGSINWNSNLYAGVGGNVGGGGNFNDGITVGGSTGGPSNNTTDGTSVANSGSSVQPFLVTNYIIKI